MVKPGHDPAICINPFIHPPAEQPQLPFIKTEFNWSGWVDKMVDRVVNAPHPTTLRFQELLKDIADLHAKKAQDYGTNEDPLANIRASEKWGVPAWVGALMRLNDEVVRLQCFARDKELVNESAEDNMLGIAVYALIALVLYEEATNNG